MKQRNPLIHYCLILLMVAGMILVAPANTQSQAMPRDRDDNVTRQQLASFDNFLDGHPEVAEQLRKDPSLVNNQQFVAGHPALQEYLTQHPEIREEISQNPNAFMHQEERFDRREDRDQDITRREVAAMDQFLDRHPEIAEQLRKDPKLIDNREFVDNHADLRQFLADHPGVREQFKEHPYAFMRDEERYDRREDRGRDNGITRAEVANMDRFLDSHPEIAEQLRKDPSLVDNKEFVANHPALQQFLGAHPGVREEFKEHPYAFMRDEERFDRREDRGRDNDVTRGELASFNQFLGSHDKIADELSKNPSLANNQEYLENHPALKDYLQAHPQVNEELSENPQTFIKSAQQFDPHGTPKMAGETKPIK